MRAADWTDVLARANRMVEFGPDKQSLHYISFVYAGRVPDIVRVVKDHIEQVRRRRAEEELIRDRARMRMYLMSWNAA